MPARNHYQILGVSRLATVDQIKRRYRYLARKYHPDVAENKETARQIFIEINDAYQTLSNPDRRLIYDAALDKEFLNYQTRVHAASRAEASQRQRTYQGVQTRSSEAHAGNPVEEARKKVQEAQSAFIAQQFRSAIAACREAIRLDRRNARAHVILGDIYRIQGFDERAMDMYTVALQLDPRNTDVQGKFDRVARKRMDVEYGYSASDRPSVYRMLAFALGWLAVLGILLYIGFAPGEPIGWLHENLKVVGDWSANLVFSMLILGILVGLLLSLHNRISPLDEELFFQGVRAPGFPSANYPVGLVLLIFNVFNFYLAAVVYVIIGLTQDSISKSVFTALAAVAGCAVACGIAYPPGWSQVMLFGGNVIFPGLLIGWMFGDMFRPSW